MNSSAAPVTAQDFQQYMNFHLPITRGMNLLVESVDEDGARMRAPLAPNKNDKGTAFGGCIAAQLLATGWCWLLSKLNRLELAADVVIQGCDIRYLRPVQGEIVSLCRAPSADHISQFESTLRRRGLARVTLLPEICGAGESLATMEARYVATLMGRSAPAQ